MKTQCEIPYYIKGTVSHIKELKVGPSPTYSFSINWALAHFNSQYQMGFNPLQNKKHYQN